MSKIPILKPLKLIRILKKLGFKHTRSKGSHFRFIHLDGRRTTVPVHKGKTLGKGLLLEILDDIEMNLDEFRKLL